MPPPPPPSTAEEAYQAVTETDPATLPDEEREKWVEKVGSAFNRLPAHEFQKLVEKSFQDGGTLRERFESLPPEQRRKMGDLIGQEQQFAMMLQMVRMLKELPAPLRKTLMQQGMERMRGRERKGGHPEITKDRMLDSIGSTPPTKRAEFVRAMRDLRKMAEEAGIRK